MTLQLKYRAYGEDDRPPVVLLHGLFGSATNWGSVARALATDYRVLVPDLRNHGQSPHHPTHSYAAMADDVLGLLDSHAIARAVIIGHSMGGKVAMHLALRDPQRVSTLGVVDIAPVDYAHDFQDVLDAFDAVDLTRLGNRSDADAQMSERVSEPGLRGFLLQNLVQKSGAWGWRLNLSALATAQAQLVGFPTQPAGARFDGPVALIHGALSDYVLPQHRPRIEAYFPNARFCRVADAGHWVYAEQPKGFLDCLGRILTFAD